ARRGVTTGAQFWVVTPVPPPCIPRLICIPFRFTERICPFGRILADPPVFRATVRPGGVRFMFPLLAVVVPRPPAVTPLPPVVPGLPAVPPIFPAVFVPAGFPAVPVVVRPFTVVFVRVLVEVPILPVVLVPVLPVFMVLAWPVEPGVVRVF